MRIITGTARGVKLDTVAGEEITRPTADRVKEGLFSAIQFEIKDKTVLDLFGGSGQLALEALSRGAKSAVIIDENEKAVEIIKSNALKTKLKDKCTILRRDYAEYLKSINGKQKFDLIFLDPPYAKDIPREVLKRLSRVDIVEDGGLIVCESDTDNMNSDIHGFTFIRKYKYGRTIIALYKKHYEQSTEACQDKED